MTSEDSDRIIRATSAQLRLGVWRRVSRGVAHDLLNAVMPLRSLGLPAPTGGGDVEARSQLARDTAERITGLGLGLHRLEASIKDDAEEDEGRWPLFREMIRWAVPRGVRIEHHEGGRDLGSDLTPVSATLVFWTIAFCGELVEPETGEIAIAAGDDHVTVRLPKLAPSADEPVAAEARAALQELARSGEVTLDEGGTTVTIRVSYRRGGVPAQPRRARA